MVTALNLIAILAAMVGAAVIVVFLLRRGD
jgi:hypothetical protein